MTSDMTAAQMRQAAQALLERAAEADRIEAEEKRKAFEAAKPKEPGIGSIVRFAKVQSGRTYLYAAIHGGGTRWAVTNTVSGVAGRYTWEGLLSFIGPANWSGLVLLDGPGTPLCPTAPPVVERIGDHGEVLETQMVEDWHGKAGQSEATPAGTTMRQGWTTPRGRNPFDPAYGQY